MTALDAPTGVTLIGEWLDQLYGAAEVGWLNLLSFDAASGMPDVDWAQVGDLGTLAASADLRATDRCVWFGVATRRAMLDGRKRGGDEDCLAIPGLWADIDIAGPGHKSDRPLAADLDAALALVRRFHLAPTAIVHTGGGIQPWWLFNELVDVDVSVRRLLAGWEATWNRLATEEGIYADPVFDVARVMRLPGTTNRKEGLARPVTILEADWSLRYGLDDLETWVDEPRPAAAPSERTTTAADPDQAGTKWAVDQTWADLLTADGWTFHRSDASGEQYWTRPGKDRGTSATVGYRGNDVLYVLTTSVPELQPNTSYNKFAYLAFTRFGGDFKAAHAHVKSLGYHRTTPLTLDQPTPPPAGPEPWPEPAQLPPPPRPPDFPVGTLPVWAQAHAIAVADQVQVPVDLAAMLIIGSLSAACTGRARVHVSANWSEPANLYLVTAMRSGAGKSPAEKLCVDWLKRWQRERIAALRPEWEKANQMVRLAEKRHAALERNSLGGNDEEVLAALAAASRARDELPVLPRLIADDATPEAVAMLLKNHGERLAIMSTEADLFDMVLRGKTGQRASINVYLKAWSGDSFTRDRKGGSEVGPEYAELVSPLLTVAITVQPSVLARVQGDDEMVSRGFAARFMFSLPPDMIGRRDQSRRFRAERLSTIDQYETEATRLATKWATWGGLGAQLHFDRNAAALLEGFLTEIEPQLGVDQGLEYLGEWANKLHGSIVRYAGLLHLAEGRDTSAPVTIEIVERAIELGRYWLAHAVAVLGLQEDRVAEQAEAILEWMATQGRAEYTLSEVQKAIRRPGLGLDGIADFVGPFQMLVDLGWLRWEPDAREPRDSRRVEDWRSGLGIRGVKSPCFALWPSAVGMPRRAHVSRAVSCEPMGERDSLSNPPKSLGNGGLSTLPPAASPHPMHAKLTPREPQIGGSDDLATLIEANEPSTGAAPAPLASLWPDELVADLAQLEATADETTPATNPPTTEEHP